MRHPTEESRVPIRVATEYEKQFCCANDQDREKRYSASITPVLVILQ